MGKTPRYSAGQPRLRRIATTLLGEQSLQRQALVKSLWTWCDCPGLCRRIGTSNVLLGLITFMVAGGLWLAPGAHAAVADPCGDPAALWNAQGDCTIGVASGIVTEDGRPLLWKVRDVSEDARQQLVYTTDTPYSYIGVCTEGEGIYMGVNEAGVAVGNSLVKLTSAPAPNSSVQSYILQNFETVGQIEEYFRSDQQAGTCEASGCFPLIDASGDAKMLEVERSNALWIYDSLDPGRRTLGLYGLVIRANEFHMRSNGMDNTAIGGRYASGVYNALGLTSGRGLSVRGLLQGKADLSQYYEFIRYGPSRSLATISRDTTCSAILVQGVLPEEDPAMTTMWVILGQTNYSIAVPTWARVSDLPDSLASGQMYDRALSLWSKGNEQATQASIYPLELHMLNVVTKILLPHWRAYGVPAASEMTRIEHRMAEDAYSLLNCLDSRQIAHRLPSISLTVSPDTSVWNFAVAIGDFDGMVVTTEWDFGDGDNSSEVSPSHTYAEPGTYLVSCTVTDDHGVSMTAWNYCAVAVSIDASSSGRRTTSRRLNSQEIGRSSEVLQLWWWGPVVVKEGSIRESLES